MTRKSLFATDFDGTLFLDKRIDKHTVEEIARFRRLGGLFGVCSGRDKMTMTGELERFSIEFDFMIMLNGARIEVGEVCLAQRVLHGYEKILPLLRERCIFFSVIGDGEVYMCRGAAAKLTEIDAVSEQRYMDMMKKYYAVHTQTETLAAVSQISCRTPSKQAAVRLTEDIRSLGLYAHPNSEYVDVVPDGVDKADAVAVVAAYLGVPSDCVYTAGDGRNDMNMLSRFHGFAMEQAEKPVQHAAERVVSSVGEALQAVGEKTPQ